VDLLDTPIEARSFIPFVLENADEKINVLFVANNSPIAGKTIKSLDLESHGLKVIALKRKNRWIYDPEEDITVRGGDMLIVRGVQSAYEKLRDYVEGTVK